VAVQRNGTDSGLIAAVSAATRHFFYAVYSVEKNFASPVCRLFADGGSLASSINLAMASRSDRCQIRVNFPSTLSDALPARRVSYLRARGEPCDVIVTERYRQPNMMRRTCQCRHDSPFQFLSQRIRPHNRSAESQRILMTRQNGSNGARCTWKVSARLPLTIARTPN